MGNDTSKSTIENQQLIMQLQNQLLQQQNQYNNNSQPTTYLQPFDNLFTTFWKKVGPKISFCSAFIKTLYFL